MPPGISSTQTASAKRAMPPKIISPSQGSLYPPTDQYRRTRSWLFCPDLEWLQRIIKASELPVEPAEIFRETASQFKFSFHPNPVPFTFL